MRIFRGAEPNIVADVQRTSKASLDDVGILTSADSAFLCENLCVLCGFCFCVDLNREEQTEDSAEDAN